MTISLKKLRFKDGLSKGIYMFTHKKPGDCPELKDVEPLRVKKDIIRYFVSLKDHAQSQKLERMMSQEESAELKTYYESLRDGSADPEDILQEFQAPPISQSEYDAIPQALLNDEGVHLPRAFIFRMVAGTVALAGLLVYLFTAKTMDSPAEPAMAMSPVPSPAMQKSTKSIQDRLLRKEIRKFSGKNILFVDLELPVGDAPKRYMAEDLMGLRDESFYAYRFRYFYPQNARQPHSDFFACPEKLTLTDRFKFHDRFDGMLFSWNDHQERPQASPVSKNEPISSAPR